MLILCTLCSADVTERDCGCRAPQQEQRSHFLDTVRLAVELGGGCVTETSLAQASRVLAEEPS